MALFLAGNLTAQDNTIKQQGEIANAEKKTAENRANVTNPSVASSNFNVNYYRCEWMIDPAVYYISGTVTTYFKITSKTNQVTMDLTKKLKVDSIKNACTKTSFYPNDQ